MLKDGAGSMDEEERSRISDHIHQISRHRQQWERPKTPPGYWNIGFPDTQQAAEINERARGMHQEQMAMVENEARWVLCLRNIVYRSILMSDKSHRQGGRYKRRKL